MAINFTNAFTDLGKLLFAAETIDTQLAAIHDEVEDYKDALDSNTLELQATASQLMTVANTARQTGLSSLMNAIRTAAVNYVVELVRADNPQPNLTLEDALAEWILQMTSQSESVDASVPGGSISADGGNTGNGVWVFSTKRGDGKQNENILAEDLIATASGPDSFSVKGEFKRDTLETDWPAGSGTSTSIPVVKSQLPGSTTGPSNLLLNGSFTDEDDRANTPDDWEYSGGTIGTQVVMTDLEVQTVAISGTPTSGTYTLSYTNADSEVQTTSPLAYNASAADVEAALRKLKGLERVTVTSSGTTPNFTHTVTFVGNDSGNITELTSANTFNTGSIAHATTTAGSTDVYTTGKAVRFVGNGSVKHSLKQRLNGKVSAKDVLNGCLFIRADASSTGVLRVALEDGAGNVVNDEASTANSTTIDVSAVGTSYESKTWTFRVPDPVPDVLYLEIEWTTALANTKNVSIDHVALAKATRLYPGGPYVSVFEGSVPFIAGDKATITPTNGREGEFQEWFNRLFDMAGKDLLLPSNAAGSETISDNLLA